MGSAGASRCGTSRQYTGRGACGRGGEGTGRVEVDDGPAGLLEVRVDAEQSGAPLVLVGGVGQGAFGEMHGLRLRGGLDRGAGAGAS